MTDKIILALNEIDLAGLKRPYLNEKFSVSVSEIEEAEKRLGYSFPISYRSFLKLVGSGGFEGVEFYGLIPNQPDYPGIPNAVWFTKCEQKDMDLPETLFAFQDLDGDADICLDVSRMDNGECPVIHWEFSESHERQLQKPYVLGNTFGDYFYNKIKELIQLATYDV